MARTAEAAQVRMKAPPMAEDADPEALLYRPVPQLAEPPMFKMRFEWFSAEKAGQWLDFANSDPDFRQRPTSLAQVRRWRGLYKTSRFVNFLPNQPICLADDNSIMMNGKHRLTALAGMDTDDEFGFVVISGVPRWMFHYFDTNKVRTIKDVFEIGARKTGPQTPSLMRLGMRYEEFLGGVRAAHGWRHWAQQRDEHQDIDDFLARRGELQDWYGVGEKIGKKARLLLPSVAAFRFYQALAWPDGDDTITEFCENLLTGGGKPHSPALTLREWAREAYFHKTAIYAKRELHLLLLMRCFEQHVNGTKTPSITWAYGQPMSVPYHPGGFEAGLANIKSALADMDDR